MTKNFSLFLAKRYLLPKGPFVMVINAISILGVMLGVAIMIIVLAVMKGFERELKEMLLGFEPHVVLINPFTDTDDIPKHYEIQDQLDKMEGVKSFSPFVMGQAFMEFDHRRKAPMMRAIPVDDIQLKLLEEKGLLVEGELTLEDQTDSEGTRYSPIIISKSIADLYRGRPGERGLGVGDLVKLYSPMDLDRVVNLIEEAESKPEQEGKISEMVKDVLLPQNLVVTAIINTPLYQETVIVPLYVGQELYELSERGDVHGIAVYTDEPYQVGVFKNQLLRDLERLGPGRFDWDTRTWIDLNQERFNAIATERMLVSTLLFFIIIVAAFCIMNTIIVTTVQKRREIGVMKAIGARVWQIVLVFVLQGKIVGLIGTLTGVGAGLLVVSYLNPIRDWLSSNFNIDPFPETIYGLPDIPTQLVPIDVVVIGLSAVIVCTLAAIPPAWAVARMDAARALRND